MTNSESVLLVSVSLPPLDKWHLSTCEPSFKFSHHLLLQKYVFDPNQTPRYIFFLNKKLYEYYKHQDTLSQTYYRILLRIVQGSLYIVSCKMACRQGRNRYNSLILVTFLFVRQLIHWMDNIKPKFCDDNDEIADLYTPLSPKVSWYIQGNGEHWKQKDEDGLSPSFMTIIRQDYFK